MTGYYDWMISHADDPHSAGLGAAFTGVSFLALIVSGLVLLKVLGGKRSSKAAVSDQ